MSRADRNYNKSYMAQELERISRTPETFLARWYSKSMYEAKVGLKAEVKTNVKHLVKLYKKQKGRSALCENDMKFIRGKGRVKCNISVARKNRSGTFNSWNIYLLCTDVHHNIIWRKNLFNKPTYNQ